MFHLSSIKINVGTQLLSVQDLSFSISGDDETIFNLLGEPVGQVFNKSIKGDLKLLVDLDHWLPVFREVKGKESLILIESEDEEQRISLAQSLSNSFFKEPRSAQSIGVFNLEFKVFLTKWSEKIESKAGIRQAEVEFSVVEVKINDENLLWDLALGQFIDDSYQIKVDGNRALRGVLADISYKNKVLNAKHSIEGSSVSYRVLQGWDEGVVSCRILVFDSREHSRKETLDFYCEMFESKEQAESKDQQPKIWFFEHEMLRHNRFFIEDFSWKRYPRHMEISLELREFQVNERDKERPSIQPTTRGAESKIIVTSAGNTEKREPFAMDAQKTSVNNAGMRRTEPA